VGLERSRHVSSANSLGKLSVAMGRTFKYMVKNSGPSVDPYETPPVISVKEDLT